MKKRRTKNQKDVVYSIVSFQAILAFIAIVWLFVIVPPLLPIYWIYGWWSDKRWRKKYEGECYFVCTPRHNWHDFLANNLLPALPDNIHVVWERKGVTSKLLEQPSKIFPKTPRPYLAKVERHKILVVSLNTVLYPLKIMAKKD